MAKSSVTKLLWPTILVCVIAYWFGSRPSFLHHLRPTSSSAITSTASEEPASEQSELLRLPFQRICSVHLQFARGQFTSVPEKETVRFIPVDPFINCIFAFLA